MRKLFIFLLFLSENICIQIKVWLTIAWFVSSKIVGREAISPWQGRSAVEIAEKFSKVCKRSNCSSGRVRGGLIIDSSIHHHVVIISWVINWSIGVRRLHYQIIIILQREMALSAKMHCFMIELFILKEIRLSIWWSFYYSNLLLYLPFGWRALNYNMSKIHHSFSHQISTFKNVVISASNIWLSSAISILYIVSLSFRRRQIFIQLTFVVTVVAESRWKVIDRFITNSGTIFDTRRAVTKID